MHIPFLTRSSKQFRNKIPELINKDYRGPAVAMSTPAPRNPPLSLASPGTIATTPQISNWAVNAIFSATANVAEDDEPLSRHLPILTAISTADDDVPLLSPSLANADAVIETPSKSSSKRNAVHPQD
mmetsp:Transcript_6048/g.13256  ORF Transcript_6048/g.13256 Transcript_6048/m.13256 type:complete len:127 (+) Transcript_6048:814-1194(+)